MEIRGRATSTLLLVFVTLFFSNLLHADVTASILGVVRDRSQAVVTGARVVVTNAQTNYSQETTSASDGSYHILALPVGNYKLTATASGTAAITAFASDSVILGRRCNRFHSSSSKSPMRIGVRLTWNVLAPMRALARFSFTYAFMPEMIATTATRNATDTMIPSSVKNDRSLLTRICWSAVMITSAKRIDLISETGAPSATSFYS